MKRFYKTVSVAADRSITLDGKPILTPAKAKLVAPTRRLAHAIAQEWHAQDGDILPASMPLTKLANTAIDRTEVHRCSVVAELAGFGAHDLLCYRATEPENLSARQQATWDPLLDWTHEVFGARLLTTRGVGHVQQDSQAISALNRALEMHDAWMLTGMHAATTITGSLILALAVSEERLSCAEAFAISRIDESFQAEKWGLDAEAEARARRLAEELEMAGRFMALSKPDVASP